jgi:hypothetical protein
MRLFVGVMTALSVAILAGCSTTPAPAPVAPRLVVPEKQPLPYRWTQGNAPKAYEQAVAMFGPLNMRPGEYRWAPTVPEKGETKVVIDLLTQQFYVYRAEQLIGVSTISSGKKGK